MNELELAENIRDGTVLSPIKFSNTWLVNLRITGTGAAYRAGIDEFVWRDPDLYLNDEFLRRCNGLPVIANHPKKDNKLNEEEFKDRVVGSVMLPYIKGDEVWAVVRIYVEWVIEEILKGTVSTSPSVLFNEESQNIEITNDESGTTLLIEGKPFLLDHIALVTEECGTNGVWDKGNGPSGVDNSNKGNLEMNEEEMKKLLEATIGGLASTFSVKLDALATRMDSMEQGAKARADAEAAEKERKEQERADSEAEATKAKEEKERADAEAAEAQARADSEAAAAEQAKADSEAQAKVEEEVKSDAEAMAGEQVKADSAFSAIGQKAPSPHAGELSADYIKRTLSIMQKYAPSFAQANIRAIADSATLKTMQDAIFAESKKEFERKVSSTPGRLIEMVRLDAAGRPVRHYQGDMDTWLRTVKVPAQKLVKFNSGSTR